MNTAFDTEKYNYPFFDKDTKQKIDALQASIALLETNLISADKETDKTVDKAIHLSNMPSIQLSSELVVNYADELNTNQLLATTTISGQVLVIAGAGSGKTKTLTYRTSFLIEQGVSPSNILLLTFTRKAANEIKARVKQQLGDKFIEKGNVINDITSGTFHSFCNMLLRRYAKILGIHSQFTILDTGDSEDAIDLVVKENKFQKIGNQNFPRKKTLQVIISSCRNRRLTVEQLVTKSYPELMDYIETIEQIAKEYHDYKRNKHLYDFDDIISQVVVHLKKNVLFRERVQAKYQHIMVDEYQDTNIPQKELIDLIAQQSNNQGSLMVVGDDNQSIYAFRGANYQNILLFGQTYPNAKLLKLEQNYRSTPAILAFVNALSDQITLGYQKSLFSNAPTDGDKPTFTRCDTERTEAKYIADKVIELKSRLDYRDFAVLGRTSYQSNYVQLEFMERGIPFIVVGGIKFVERRHIKDVLAFVRVLYNPEDAISWHRILTMFQGIGEVTATKISASISVLNGTSSNMFEALLNPKFTKKSEQLEPLYQTLHTAQQKENIAEILDIILDFYTPVLQLLEENWKERAEDFRVLQNLAKEHNRIDSFLESLALDPPNDSVATQDNAQQSDDDVVTISTIHSSKGLEWQAVFVNTLIDGMMPHHRSCQDFEELEEERKLFYVACSRAKTRLFLSAPNYLSSYSGYFDKVSRFVAEVPSACLCKDSDDKNNASVDDIYNEVLGIDDSGEDWW